MRHALHSGSQIARHRRLVRVRAARARGVLLIAVMMQRRCSMREPTSEWRHAATAMRAIGDQAPEDDNVQ